MFGNGSENKLSIRSEQKDKDVLQDIVETVYFAIGLRAHADTLLIYDLYGERLMVVFRHNAVSIALVA